MKVLLLAGEESGVMYAERIAEAIRGRVPSAEIRGYGDYGFKTGDLAVMGVGQVLLRLFYFLRVKRTMERAIDEWRPDIVCTVDYPGLNLKLAAMAKRRGIRTVHVVCPQVWAWKNGRIPKIEASLDKLCCFFPFEPKLFKPGFAEFVGHPLVDAFASKVEERGGGGRRREKILAVLPGSRIGEIEKHMPTLLGAVEKLQQEIPDLKVAIPAANDRAYEKVQEILGALSTRHQALCTVQHGEARAALNAADAAIVASGTATLEAALAGCPTVLVYRVGWFFAFLARRVIKGIRHIGLANIIAEKAGAECPMPELLQENLTVANVLQVVRPWLTDESANAAARQSLADTMRLLRSDGGAIARIAACVLAIEKGCKK